MLDWRSFSLLLAMMRFGSRNEDMLGHLTWDDRDEPLPETPEGNFSDLRESQDALLDGIAHTLQTSHIKPYRKLMGRLTQRPAG